jgi:histidyl-tRNA synthetase
MHVVEDLPLVTPRTSRGLPDLLPAQARARHQLIEAIREGYELYGFLPLNTPAIEYRDVLFGSAGPDAEKQSFHVVSPEHEELGLRHDLTVPLARVVSQYPDLPRPFRRYQVAPVWRADKPDPGRFREFIQFDLDSVGAPSEVADTEVVAGMCDTLTKIAGRGHFIVRVSSRGVLDLLLLFARIPHKHGAAVIRALDKVDRIGFANVRRELMEGYDDASGARIRGIGLTGEQIDLIEMFLGVQHEHRRDLIAALYDLFTHIDGAAEKIGVLERISNHLYSLEYGDDQVVIDVSIARGLAYYTGPIFEAHLLDAPQFGAVFSGGRYDGLTMRFLGERIPAVGASIGVDRLLAALTHLGKVRAQAATAHVLVTCIDPHLTSDYLAMTWELRRAGVPTELYLGEATSPGKQLKYADRLGIPLAVLYGAHEKEHGIVSIKNLAEGKRRASGVQHRDEWLSSPTQVPVERAHLIHAVRHMIAENAQ